MTGGLSTATIMQKAVSLWGKIMTVAGEPCESGDVKAGRWGAVQKRGVWLETLHAPPYRWYRTFYSVTIRLPTLKDPVGCGWYTVAHITGITKM